MPISENSHASDAKYFVQILGGICVVGAVVNILFKKAHFISLSVIATGILGLLLVQFSLSLKGPDTKMTFMSILKKIFHFRNLVIMLLLTSWVFDIYLNNYNAIQSNTMPDEFYNISNAYTFVLLLQVFIVVGKIMSQQGSVSQLKTTHGESDVFKKISALYNSQTSSLNALLNCINLLLVLMLYVISQYFITDG